MKRDNMTAEQEARLPNYARQEMTRLRRALAEAEAERDELRRQVSGDPDGSNTFLEDWGHDVERPLGHSPQIRFDMDEKGSHLRVSLTRDGRALEIRSSSGGLTVAPRVSNVIEIAVTEP